MSLAAEYWFIVIYLCNSSCHLRSDFSVLKLYFLIIQNKGKKMFCYIIVKLTVIP